MWNLKMTNRQHPESVLITFKIDPMNCPVCNVTLLMTDKQGIEIDYCPQCRGIWLDRGELEKLIEKASQSYDSNGYGARPPYRESELGHDSHDSHGSHGGHGRQWQHGQGQGKRKGLLGELFDF
jgi:Zn-finger nucleic acid-binding protein